MDNTSQGGDAKRFRSFLAWWSKLGQWLIADCSLKLFALLIAIFLWIMAASGYKENIRMPVDLKFEGLRPNLLILEQSVEKLDVTIRGTSHVINSLTADQIIATHSLADVHSPKDLTVRILPEEIKVPPGAFVTSVMPSSIRLKVGKKATVRVPVELAIKGTPAPNFKIVSKTSEPKTVLLEGPESVLSNVESIRTEAINVDGVTEPFTGRAYLIPIHPLVKFVDTKSVLARIDVQERTTIKKFLSVPIQQVPPERPVSIVPPRINVDLRGPVSALAKVTEEQLVGIVDVMDLRKGRYLRTPRFDLPEGISVKSRDPDKVTIIIKGDGIGGE